MLRQRLIQALKKDLPYRQRSPFKVQYQASVLVLFAIDLEGSEYVLITKRSEGLDSHPGQYSFPGGRVDEQDQNTEQTALRECFEEVGIHPSQMEVLGILPQLRTPSGYESTPVVALLKEPVNSNQLYQTLSSNEVEFILWTPLLELKSTYRLEELNFKGMKVHTDVFYVDDTHRIWGMTGAILQNLLLRLEILE